MCQCIGFVDEENTAHGLVAERIDHLRGLSLIGADHLRAVNLDHMATVQIADGGKYFAKLAGHGCLTRSGITCKHDVH